MIFIGNIAKTFCNIRINTIKVFVKQKMKLAFDPSLKGMKVLNKELFKLNLEVPAIKIRKNDYTKARKIFKAYLLESVNLKRYQDLNPEDPLSKTHKYVVLDPEEFELENLEQNVKDEFLNLIKQDQKQDSNNPKSLIENLPIEVSYDDLKFDDVMKAIIPDNLLNENIGVKGYSIIGHIAHFNLRDQVLDYKNIIGEFKFIN